MIPRIDRILPVAGLCVWAVPMLLLLRAPGSGHATARVMTLLLALATAYVIARRAPVALVSPLFVLGAVSLAFFSLTPWLALLPAVEPIVFLRPFAAEAARAFLEGHGELVVLQFSAACLTLAAVLAGRLGDDRAFSRDPQTFLPARTARIAATVAIGLLLLGALPFAAAGVSDGAARWLANGAGRELMHGAPPVMAVALAALFHIAVGRAAGWFWLAMGASVIVVVALMSTLMAKLAVFVVLAGAGAYAVRHRPSGRRLAAVVLCGLAFLVVALVTMGLLRQLATEGDIPSYREGVQVVAVAKVLLRQTVTVGCFQEAIRQSAPDGKGGGPLYFVSSVVPRALWPDKPSLSRGDEYAVAYCGMPPESVSADTPQSESITLLGEPVVQAGWAGLAAAQLFLLAVLAAITRVGLRSGAVGAIALTALLPWLVDFDQSFALYVANAVKMFLWMIPPLLGLLMMARIAGRGRMPAPAPSAPR